MGLLDHGQLQRDQPADLLVQEGAHEHPDPVRGVDRHQHRHVVRAVRDHRDVAAPRLPALVLGLLQSHDLGRDRACSEASGSSSRCSACSCAFCRWWPPPRSRRSCRRPIRMGSRTEHGSRTRDHAATEVASPPLWRRQPAPDGASRCRWSRGSRRGRTTESSPNSRRRRTSITRASGCVTRASPDGTPTARSPSTA